MKNIYKTGRGFYTHLNSLAGLVRYLNLPVLGYYALLVTLPALLPGCAKPGPDKDTAFTEAEDATVKVSVLKTSVNEIGDLDVFVFNDDALQRLDCYQRFSAVSGSVELDIASRSGDKNVTVCANPQRTKEEWKGVNSRESLSGVAAELEKEKRDMPLMTGETRLTAGTGRNAAAQIRLERLASEVVLRSIGCDFSGKPYAGEKLADIKVYLTNVNASCRIMSEGGIAPERIVNAGGLCQDDMERFPDKSMIVQDIRKEIGKTAVRTDVTLMCYPNCGTEDSPGSPFTRLVIEGRIGNDIWYWPININRSDDGSGTKAGGIERNCRYVYDLMIRRKGSSDPDTPVSEGTVGINLEIKEWDTKEEYGVRF